MPTQTRNRAPAQNKKNPVPLRGGWDVLPHGLGKKGDLVKDEVIDDQELAGLAPPLTKKLRQGRVAKSASLPANRIAVLIVAKPLQKELPKKRGRKAEVVHDESVVKDEDEDEDYKDVKPKAKRAVAKRRNLETSAMVSDKAEELVENVGTAAGQSQKKKAHPYGLTPGSSPFPQHLEPTPEQCEEVKRLLSELHGDVKPPEKIPPPSMDVTGCGEVPDLLDAILRTLLSAATTANNSNLSLKGLKDRFGLRTSGNGKGSVNWEAVLQADVATIEQAIKSGGLAAMKSKNIKNILTTVHKENCARRDALVKEKKTGETADILGAEHESQKAKDLEIAKADENMLSMDHVFEMTTEDAMEELTKLPGIGVKTASCVILFCMKRPSFAVDTHVWRHCKMLGWVPPSASRDKTFSHCEVRVPDHLKYPLHQLFLRHGRTCGRCAAKGSEEDYKNTVCPIEHLVNRPERKRGAAGKKRKQGEDTEDEGEVEGANMDGDDYDMIE